MSNALYDYAREGYLSGGLNWLTDDVRAVLVDAGQYVVNLSTHQFLVQVPTLARISVSTSLTAKTATAGVADAAEVTFLGVSGATVEALVLYRHTGTDATSRLICYIDTAVGLPFTPTGGNVVVRWDPGASRIFKL